LNETSVRTLGLEDPIGKKMPLNDSERTIVGVVRDFHLLSLHSAIEPMVLARSSRPSYVSVRIAPGDFAQALDQIGGVWKTFAPDYPFEYFFLEEALDQLYSAEERLAELFYAFALIAVFIACLGLFGLVAFTAERRTREISIRKVFGASEATIVRLLTRDFLRLVAIAFVLAAPLAYFSVRAWLQNFAYRTEPGPGVFLLAGLVLLLLTVKTAGSQALRAARAQPNDALRQE
jgi:putative ABC transport system permease protein